MVSVINYKEEYNAIMAILLKLPFGTDLSRYQELSFVRNRNTFLY
ncbi:hypothetical protein AAJ76_1000085924 [Vairimorpha ceranae]|uniref:Uncharacterized protein n=1 Tax=Vairimorpha ceranae TaxID=40302 RepID=A0A0F9WST8_9MICR|nr:hypothetical protein AAJ76_1000085924 [Vairimorpha ceranae]KKO75898.1 hypothetical protein AAJ76_1000085924 [Vairimorpha ceranae]